MDRSLLLSRFSDFSFEEAERCASTMLSDFQQTYFDRYYANPFPLKKSAVLLLLYLREGKLKSIMIERSDFGKHAGQISFPGGKAESSDADITDTAIRETKEEIGLCVKRKDVIGTLPPVKVPFSGFEIFPNVAFVETTGNFKLSESEVKKVLEVDIEDMHNSFDIRHITVAGKQYEVPSYLCGNSVVWGATAMIVAELFSVLK